MAVVGTQQSPIKIETCKTLQIVEPTLVLRIEYDPSVSYTGKFKDPRSGHGNLVLDPPYPIVLYHGSPFELRKVHIHLKSEHLVDSDDPADFEVHLLHLPQSSTSDSDPKVVIGILYKHGSSAPSGGGLESLDLQLKKRLEKGASRSRYTDGDATVSGFNPIAFFPKPNGTADLTNWFHYQGSLTSEPYTEDVSWFVMRTLSDVDPAQTQLIEENAEQHSRRTYPLDRRIVVRNVDGSV